MKTPTLVSANRIGTTAKTRLGRALFGDRVGLVLFLGCLCFVMVYWRVGVFITDNVTLRETLTALDQGHLWVEPATDNFLSTPGANVRDGFVYGRNYGQLVVSLPVLWGLQLVSTVADLHVALVAIWHLLALAFAVHIGIIGGLKRPATLAGSVIVFGSFVLNLALVTTFTTPSLSLIALQMTAAIATGFIAVFLYRLFARRGDGRLGVLAGVGAVVAMPVGFWATIPKRHVFSALVCVAILYAFVRSREDGTVVVPYLGSVPAFRAAAYALVGFLTWVHAAEGLFVFLALVTVDVPTAPSNDLRTLFVVGAAFTVSLLPFVVTNLFVSGELVQPPRTLGSGGFTGATQGAPADATTAVSDTAGGSGDSDETGIFGTLVSALMTLVPLAPLMWLYAQITHIVVRSVNHLSQFNSVYQTFVQSSIEGIGQDARFLGVNLAVLEAAPVFGIFSGVLVGTIRSSKRRASDYLKPSDVLALALSIAFLVIYVQRLPLRTQITVRYLLPLYPLGAYLLVRSQFVRQIFEAQLPALLWSYAGGVLIGGQLLLAFLLVEQYAVAEAARLHATLGVGIGGILALLSLGSLVEDRLQLPTAIALGLAAAAGTIFLLLSGLHYFSFTGEYVLPVADALSDLFAAAG